VTGLTQALAYGAKLWRSIAGQDTSLERYVKARYMQALKTHVSKNVGRDWVEFSGADFLVIRSKTEPGPRVGILMRGKCDLPSMFATAPFIRRKLRGTIAIYKQEEKAATARSDQLLQTLENIPTDILEQGLGPLQLSPQLFEADLFDPDPFEIQGFPHFGRFPKTAIVLSIASDLARSLYRHKEYGYVVDLGRWWLDQTLEKAVKDLDTLNWFKSNFESIGRISVDQFQRNFEQIIRLLRERTGAQVIVFNNLVLDPLNPTHNYQLFSRAHSVRRREFHVALAELSAKLNFHIIDVDRILKEQGIREAVDFAHFPIERMVAIGEDAYRILRELEVV
jgi:hypothetical protein